MAIPTSIQDFLKSHGTRYTPIAHPVAYTAQEEAARAHVPGREWAKTVVCVADGEPVQAILPAHYRVDFDRLRRLAGARSLRLAEETEIADLYPDCEPGAAPPFGPLFGQRVFVDDSLTTVPELVFAAGTHGDAVRMAWADFDALVHPVTGSFGQPPAH